MNGTKVSQEKVDRILEAINLAPTSLGLQAFKVLVIENNELKEQILAEACPQQPIKECSHLLVFTSYTQVTENTLDEYFALIEKVRNPGKEWCDHYREKIEFFMEKNYGNVEGWLASQVYIALGVACTAAANERVDSVPIEGFNKEVLNSVLHLAEKGLTSVVLLPLGYKDEVNDWLNNVPKVRKDSKDLFEVIK
jgi:nitroreductase